MRASTDLLGPRQRYAEMGDLCAGKSVRAAALDGPMPSSQLARFLLATGQVLFALFDVGAAWPSAQANGCSPAPRATSASCTATARRADRQGPTRQPTPKTAVSQPVSALDGFVQQAETALALLARSWRDRQRCGELLITARRAADLAGAPGLNRHLVIRRGRGTRDLSAGPMCPPVALQCV
jgi:hypothetical protein